MTYLELVNKVLIRLREGEVSSVSDNTYSKMIGEFVNDAKRSVENAYNWNSLKDTISVNTVAGTYSYTLTGSGNRFKVTDVINDTSNWFLQEQNNIWFNEQLLTQTQQQGAPRYYCFNGVDSNGDAKVNVLQIPDNTYTLVFNMIIPQADLSSNSDTIKVPSEPVIFLAYAKAIVERGEDGGLASSEAYGLFKQSLADYIALEDSRSITTTDWYWV